MARPAKRQITKPTKRQVGFAVLQLILTQIETLANGVRDALHKGRGQDQRTGQAVPLPCPPADVKRAASPEQLAAIEEFIATWATEPAAEAVRVPAPAKPEPKPKKK